MYDVIEKLTQMIKERKAIQEYHMSEDKARYNDPFLSQHMRGRVSVEENDIEWLTDLLAVLE